MILEVVDIRIEESKQAEFDEAMCGECAQPLPQPRDFGVLK